MKKSWTKSLLAGVIVIAVVIAAVWLFSGQGSMDLSEYHPFKSPDAKARYLAMYDERAMRWPVASETRMVKTSYGQTFVRISGPRDAPPLVLLHGAGGNSLQWIPNIKALSADFRTYAVDNISDFGRSVYTKPIEGPKDFVTWLDDLFNALELAADINLVGLSYGGWIASQYALHSPARLRKVVLLAPAGTVLPLSAKWIGRAVLCTLPARYFTRSFIYWLLEDLARQGDAGKKFLEEHVEESYLALQCFKSKRMVNPSVLTDKELQSITTPVLYLVGENEKICSARKAVQRLREAAPHIKAEVIPGAGHDLTIVQARLVNKKILDFLKQP